MTTETATPAETPVAVLARLRQQLAAMPDPASVVGAPMQAKYWRERSALDTDIGAIESALSALTDLDAQIAADTRWRDKLTAWRKPLGDALLALQSPIRDAYTLGVQRNLVLSIRVIDFGLGVLTDTLCGLPTLRLGHLMRESGDGSTEWQGSLREIDHDLKELSAMRADADVRLTRIIAKRRQS